MKKRIVRIVSLFLLGLASLFVFRILYGYMEESNGYYEENEYISDFFVNAQSDGRAWKRNYASDKYSQESNGGKEVNLSASEPSPVSHDQKFEKIASLKSKTDAFEKDENTIRANVKTFNALIQYEHNEGNPGSRQLNLSIGVPPANFDKMLAEIKKIGRLKDIQVTKTDMTNEYRDLNAKKNSLEKTRSTLIELKSKDGKIDEFVALSNRILEIEQELQGLGVQLGDFDEENEFCTVRFILAEGKFVTISFMHRVKVALEWAINYYCLFLLILLLASGTAFCCLKIYDAVKGKS